MPVIGVSIAVPAPWGPELQARRTAYGDPQGEHVPTHVTLLPPPEVTDEVLPAVREHLRQVAARVAPFEIMLSGTGTFAPVSPVVYVQVAQGVSRCEQLERMVRQGPVGSARSFPYHPHVTVVQGCSQEVMDRAFAELRRYDAHFVVDAVTLYVNEDGCWHPCEEYRLGGTAQAAADGSSTLV